MIRAGLIGGRGYVGEELFGLFRNLPDYEIVYAGSKSSAGKSVNEVYDNIGIDLVFDDLSPRSISSRDADVWIIAQANGRAAEFVEMLADSNAKIIDVSSDFRFDSSWTYGLPERNADAIRTASRVANPGCYATATQLALLPIIDQITNVPNAFGISGFSGAGRTPGEKNDPRRLADNILPYSLTGHNHEQEVSYQLGREVRLMPHVAPFFRGISMTINVELNETTDSVSLKSRFQDFFADHTLVGVVERIPEIKQVSGSNCAIVGGFAVDSRDPKRATIVSVIDNLRKGAASQLIQNLNLMFGLKSEQGLIS